MISMSLLRAVFAAQMRLKEASIAYKPTDARQPHSLLFRMMHMEFFGDSSCIVPAIDLPRLLELTVALN